MTESSCPGLRTFTEGTGRGDEGPGVSGENQAPVLHFLDLRGLEISGDALWVFAAVRSLRRHIYLV